MLSKQAETPGARGAIDPLGQQTVLYVNITTT